MSKKPKKPWDITQADVDSITPKEFIYGTDRLLPPVDQIPHEFFKGNVYTRLVEAMYVGDVPPMGEVTFNHGFKETRNLGRLSTAHLRSVQPDYDHKIAGIAYMISKIVRITSILT